VGLIVVGALNACTGLLALLSIAMRGALIDSVRVFESEAERAGYMTSQVAAIAASLLGILLAPLLIAGAVRMMNGRSYGLAKAAAILAIVPCTSPCCLAGIPVGIWALVTLGKPEVKAVFAGLPPTAP
jgi:hypothetical protein